MNPSIYRLIDITRFTSFGLTVVYFVAAYGHGTWSRFWGIISLSLLFFVLFPLYFAGKFRKAASYTHFTVIISTLIITCAIFLDGGTRSSIFVFYFVALVTAALRLGRRGTMMYALLISGLYSSIVLLELFRHTPVDLPSLLILRAGVLLLFGWISGQVAQMLFDRISATERAYRELSETQAQLIQSSKLAAVGQLAAGMAHEINNPLEAITGSAQALRKTVKGEDSELLDFILEGTERCGVIARKLIYFAQPQPSVVKDTSLTQVMDDTLDLLENQARDDRIAIIKEYESDPTVLADPNELSQVFLNILLNARDAILEKLMRDSGTGEIRLRIGQADSRVFAEIRDNGTGVSADLLPRLFDPFVTTKDVGKGTGLGLSVSLGLVKKIGGEILVKSHVGGGTTFTVSLPERKESPDA